MRMQNWVAGVLGLTVIGVAIAQQPKVVPIKQAASTATPESAKPADPLSAMLSDARAAYAKTRDYSGTFTRQERINGSLSAEQVGEMKMRVNPFGVYVRFVRPDAASGMEVAFSAAKRDGMVRYRPAGVAGRKGFQKLDVNSSKFLAANRHPVTSWGMGPLIELIATSTAARKDSQQPGGGLHVRLPVRQPERHEVRDPDSSAPRPPLCRQDGRLCGQGNQVAGAVRSL